ncbi:MAG: NnrU family protein [Alphaproteobacteria bacterium]
MPPGFAAFLAAAVALVASHAVLSTPAVRPLLVRRFGHAGFLALYSAVSLAALAAFVWGYRAAEVDLWLYQPPPALRMVAVAAMPLAVFLVVGRLTTPCGTPDDPLPPAGVYRVCRFPGSVGVLLWAALHLANVGFARPVILFATMAVIALVAVVNNERVRRRLARGGGAAHLAETSLVPFAAVAARRQRLAWAEIGWWRLALTLAVYLALLFGHPYVIGVDPLASAFGPWVMFP